MQEEQSPFSDELHDQQSGWQRSQESEGRSLKYASGQLASTEDEHKLTLCSVNECFSSERKIENLEFPHLSHKPISDSEDTEGGGERK